MKQSIHTQLNDSQWLSDQIINQKKNCAEIARELGIANRSAVNRAVKKLGLSSQVCRTKFPQLKNREWLANELKTKTLVEIANGLGTTFGNVASFAKRQGLSLGSDKSTSVKAALKKKYPNGRFGAVSSNWKGGKRIMNGYIRIYAPEHPNAIQGSMFEHRLVAEKTLGRYLTKSEVVHHINGDKQDNRPENLEVHSRKDHFDMHYAKGDNIADMKAEIARLKALLDNRGIDY